MQDQGATFGTQAWQVSRWALCLALGLAACTSAAVAPKARRGTGGSTEPGAVDDAELVADAGSQVQEAAVRAPEKLAFFYGQPSSVNASGGDPLVAIDTFKAYDILVLGNGLDAPSHPDHDKTRTIIAGLGATTRVYGYIDLCVAVANVPCTNLPSAEIHAKADRWKAMGVAGVFLDQAGYDCAVSRDRLNEAVDYVHSLSLSAFANAWIPDDIFDSSPNAKFNPKGTDTHLGPNDYALDESFAVELSQFADPANLVAKVSKEVAYRQRFGTKIAATNTVAMSNPPFEQAKLDYEWWSALLYGVDAVAWGETWTYSADTNQLPFHPRPGLGDLGTAAVPVTVTHVGAIQTRTTSKVTIEVDTANHTGRLQQGGAATPTQASNGATQPATHPTDWASGDAVFSQSGVQLTVKTGGAAITSYRVFLDTDGRATSGFLHSLNAGVGADFMIENGVLYRFGGATQTAFTWVQIGAVTATTATPGTLQVPISFSQLGLAGAPTLSVLVENVAADFTTLDVFLRAPGVWTIRP